MKIGIDSYCYHRFFGEAYPQQEAASKRMTLEDFIDRASELKVDGVSLESCFIPEKNDPGYLSSVRDRLDEYAFDRVYAWGHPDGLEGGTNHTEYEEMIGSFQHANQIGAKIMRVVGSSGLFRFENHQEQISRLVAMFRKAVKVAADCDIKMAIENHIDFTGDEILQLLEEVDSPYLGLNLDTGNFARLLDDPIKAMEKLAPYTLATHIKDLKINAAASVDDWYFFSTVPVGDGFIDNLQLARLLKRADYQGLLAMELDFLHPDYNNDEDAAVAQSVDVLRRIAERVETETTD
ncbi:sugar phosphate isomerase/epimerase family protein [Bythopirellula polymerisocia]|uniref:Inosose dehydratase n=1 Tax=Bythopirellula polymerisocia TaxID=2528003 RepID=A0A5C6CC15_9BACT|nr:sugar phosphate isomerase/epimerase family protein [Bythopirellula polymerisocia]TWU21377.1 Inosose dehydratase [Bythopirellula polymerisocia]